MAAAEVDCEALLLAATASGGVVADTFPWAQAAGVEHDGCVGAMKSLMVDGYLLSAALSKEFWVLTEEAEGYVLRGSPEAQVFGALPALGSGGSAGEAALAAQLGEALVKVGLGKCLKCKWVARDKATGSYSRLVRLGAGGRGHRVSGNPKAAGLTPSTLSHTHTTPARWLPLSGTSWWTSSWQSRRALWRTQRCSRT
jgi:phenylalanyl-tRNA synthetase alpha chain